MHDLVEKVADAFAVLSRYLENGIEAKLVKLNHPGACTAIVGLIDCKNCRLASSPDGFRYFSIPWDQAFTSVHDEDQQVGILDGPLPPLHHDLMQRILARAEHAAGVDHLEVH